MKAVYIFSPRDHNENKVYLDRYYAIPATVVFIVGEGENSRRQRATHMKLSDNEFKLIRHNLIEFGSIKI